MTFSLQTRFGFQPVIIIGAARSGTNMLRDALCDGEGVATWPCDEINAIWRHDWAAWPNDELRPEHATPRVRRFVRREFQRLAHRAQARWVLEKTCANSLRVDFVRTIVPEAKFVFLVRDGRDAMASAIKRWRAPVELRYTLKKLRYVPPADLRVYGVRFLANRLWRMLARDKRLKSWGPRFEEMDAMLANHSLAEVCAEQWSRCVLGAAHSLMGVPADCVCYVRYEDFVAQPARELDRLAASLGISLHADKKRRIAASCLIDSVGKWRRELDPETVKTIEPLFQRTMQALQPWEAVRESGGDRIAA
jgi:hypothetical protein